MRYRYWVSAGASIIVGLIFIFSGVGKLLYQTDFLVVLLANPLLTPTLAQVATCVLPWIESVLGALLIMGISAKLMASLSLVLIAGFIADNGWLIAQGLAYKPCGCFGIFERILQSKLSTLDSLVFDIGMLALVLIVLLCYPGKFFDTRIWFLRK